MSIENPLMGQTNNEAPEQESLFFNMPSSTANDLWVRTLSLGENLQQLAQYNKNVRTSTQYEFKELGKSKLIQATKGDTTTSIEIPDITKVKGYGKGVLKIFLYNLIAINEQAYSVDPTTHEPNLRQPYITYSLKDMVADGLYKNVRTARVGFLSAMKALTQGYRIRGKTVKTKGDKKTITQEGFGTPFDNNCYIKDGQCYVGLSVNFSMQILFMYYTALPRFCFQLKSNALQLIYTIFYLARQNLSDIKDRGYFTISMRVIQSRLNLPSELKNRKPEETIKEPINTAITQIENLIPTGDVIRKGKTEKDKLLKITPIYNGTGNIKNFLDKGYLKIELLGDYANTFIELATNKANKIAEAQARSEKIQDAAKAKALQNILEKQATEETTKEQ